ncbi:hypothetical protein GCM10010279_31100 [Streptomyces mutabilis]|nr:hypothetical protein GCM10010279_31100 [Streptomyces mutabilis]
MNNRPPARVCVAPVVADGTPVDDGRSRACAMALTARCNRLPARMCGTR